MWPVRRKAAPRHDSPVPRRLEPRISERWCLDVARVCRTSASPHPRESVGSSVEFHPRTNPPKSCKVSVADSWYGKTWTVSRSVLPLMRRDERRTASPTVPGTHSRGACRRRQLVARTTASAKRHPGRLRTVDPVASTTLTRPRRKSGPFGHGLTSVSSGSCSSAPPSSRLR